MLVFWLQLGMVTFLMPAAWRVCGVSPPRASHFLGRQKVTQKTTPVSLRKPAKNQKFEAPPKLGKRYRRLPQTVGVLKPQTFNFYRLG